MNGGVLVATMFAALLGCATAQIESPMGMTLLFFNTGPHTIGVVRFDPDGELGPVPGGVGSGGGKAQMTFMPASRKAGMPKFVDVEWLVTTQEVAEAQLKRNQDYKLYSPPWMDETTRIQSITPRHKRHIDLTTVITPALVAQVRANKSTTNLKLVITFNGSDVSIEAMPEKWR